MEEVKYNFCVEATNGKYTETTWLMSITRKRLEMYRKKYLKNGYTFLVVASKKVE